MDVSQQYDGVTNGILMEYKNIFHDNIAFTSRLYSNITGEYLETGHIVTFYNCISDLVQTAVMTDDTIHDMADALSRYDGVNQAFSNATEILGQKKRSLNKRTTDSFWTLFTGWGGNTGYINELKNWDEFNKAARDWAVEDDLFVINIDGCTNSNYCYAVSSKFCYAMGFSETLGADDAIVGEVYIQSWGGLDGDCETG